MSEPIVVVLPGWFWPAYTLFWVVVMAYLVWFCKWYSRWYYRRHRKDDGVNDE